MLNPISGFPLITVIQFIRSINKVISNKTISDNNFKEIWLFNCINKNLTTFDIKTYDVFLLRLENLVTNFLNLQVHLQ